MLTLWAFLQGFSVMAQPQQDRGGAEGYHIGVYTGSSALLGVDVSCAMNDRWKLRAGFSLMHFKVRQWETDFNRFSHEASINLTAESSCFSLLFDYSPWGKGFFRLVGGIGLFIDNKFSGSVKLAEPFTFNDIDFEPDELGYVYGSVHFNHSINPYLGIGLGRLHGKKRRVSLSVDIGTFYKGAPQIQVGGTNLLQNNEHNSEILTDNFSAYRWYPVLNFRINYSINPVNN
ncbi:MAG: hypothetical protein GVY26_03570 [Bacteroidetes bacterium]|jgi:hypothetical protein|nr:hypothetical protein [Bacteroidota bacterium]